MLPFQEDTPPNQERQVLGNHSTAFKVCVTQYYLRFIVKFLNLLLVMSFPSDSHECQFKNLPSSMLQMVLLLYKESGPLELKPYFFTPMDLKEPCVNYALFCTCSDWRLRAALLWSCTSMHIHVGGWRGLDLKYCSWWNFYSACNLSKPRTARPLIPSAGQILSFGGNLHSAPYAMTPLYLYKVRAVFHGITNTFSMVWLTFSCSSSSNTHLSLVPFYVHLLNMSCLLSHSLLPVHTIKTCMRSWINIVILTGIPCLVVPSGSLAELVEHLPCEQALLSIIILELIQATLWLKVFPLTSVTSLNWRSYSSCPFEIDWTLMPFMLWTNKWLIFNIPSWLQHDPLH